MLKRAFIEAGWLKPESFSQDVRIADAKRILSLDIHAINENATMVGVYILTAEETVERVSTDQPISIGAAADLYRDLIARDLRVTLHPWLGELLEYQQAEFLENLSAALLARGLTMEIDPTV